MIDPAHDLSITKQAVALNISRGSVYYLPRPVSATDLEVRLHLVRMPSAANDRAQAGGRSNAHEPIEYRADTRGFGFVHDQLSILHIVAEFRFG